MPCVTHFTLVFVAASFLWPWANPTWVKLTQKAIDLGAQEQVLEMENALVVDDDYAHVQIDLGKVTPEISKAILHRTFDKAPARGIRVEACETSERCIVLDFKGLSFSKEYYDAAYFIPAGVKRGTKFHQVRVRSQQPFQQVVLHWVSGDTG